MQKKNLIILCIVFAVLISLVLLKKIIKLQVPTTEEVSDIIEPSINSDGLTEIAVNIGDSKSDDADKLENVHLVKVDDHWIVKNHYGVYARDQIITTLLEKLDQLKGELRSNRKEILADYGIDDEQAIHVQLRHQETEDIDIAIGEQKPGYQSNFVRIGKSNAVYLVNENLVSTLGVRGEGDDQKLDMNTWVDKRITHLEPSDVVGVLITEGDGRAQRTAIDIKRELIDEKKQWKSTIPYDVSLSASKIKAMIKVFNNTYAQEVVAPDVEGVFGAPGWTGVFTLENGEQVKIVRGKEEPKGKYYVKREGAEYFYHIATSSFYSPMNQQGNIFANNPLKVDENKISEIEVRDLVNNKKFHAVKKVPEEASETEEEKEDLWETSGGEAVELAKVRDIIGKIRGITLEAVLQPKASAKNAVVVRIVKEGVSTEYTISKDLKLDTGKECQFLRIGKNTQSYCASKSTISALQNTLP